MFDERIALMAKGNMTAFTSLFDEYLPRLYGFCHKYLHNTADAEEVVQEVWPDEMHAVVSVPDENRGEIIVMVTERPQPDRDALRVALTQKGLPELAIPKKLIPVEAIPKIGVGKVDYQTATKVAAG